MRLAEQVHLEDLGVWNDEVFDELRREIQSLEGSIYSISYIGQGKTALEAARRAVEAAVADGWVSYEHLCEGRSQSPVQYNPDFPCSYYAVLRLREMSPVRLRDYLRMRGNSGA